MPDGTIQILSRFTERPKKNFRLIKFDTKSVLILARTKASRRHPAPKHTPPYRPKKMGVWSEPTK